MIDPNKTLIVGHTSITPQLATWFQAKGFEKRIIVPKEVSPLLAARNTGIKTALELATKHGFETIVFCDSDVYPAESATEEWLRLSTDVTSCRCETDNPGAFGGNEAFHWALASVKVSTLRKITPPWVISEYNEDGTKLLTCDCMSFANKAKKIGATISHAGLCVHLHRGSWHTKTY
jgi:hypothetical protein